MARPYLHTEPLDKLPRPGLRGRRPETRLPAISATSSWGSSRVLSTPVPPPPPFPPPAQAGKLHLSSFPDPEESSRFILANVDHPTTRRGRRPQPLLRTAHHRHPRLFHPPFHRAHYPPTPPLRTRLSGGTGRPRVISIDCETFGKLAGLPNKPASHPPVVSTSTGARPSSPCPHHLHHPSRGRPTMPLHPTASNSSSPCTIPHPRVEGLRRQRHQVQPRRHPDISILSMEPDPHV